MSASDSDAAMTTAASVGCGRSRSRPGKNSRISTIGGRADQAGDLGLRARLLGHRRAGPAGADREALEQAGGEVRGADADHLPLPVDLLAGRAANDDAVEIVSVRETSAMPSAPPTSRPEVGEPDVRDGERREALGQHADQRHAVVGQVESGRGDAIDSTTATSTPGTFGQPALEGEDQREPEQADRQGGGHRVAVRHALDEPA